MVPKWQVTISITKLYKKNRKNFNRANKGRTEKEKNLTNIKKPLRGIILSVSYGTEFKVSIIVSSMDEIPELVEELPTDGNIKTEKVAVTPFVPFSLTPTALEKKIPITIITGYLGSGKSTLLTNIGKQQTRDWLSFLMSLVTLRQ